MGLDSLHSYQWLSSVETFERRRIIMTRKAAIYQAIQILAQNDEYSEIVRHLQDVLSCYHKCMWDDNTVREAIDEFIKKNGRNPTSTDFKFRTNGLPPHPSVKRIYGITLGKWLEQNYPPDRPSPEELKREYADIFLAEYKRIKPASEREYDKRRIKDTPCAHTIAKVHGFNTWRKLLKHFDIPVYFDMRKDHTPLQFEINVLTDVHTNVDGCD